MTGHRGKKKIRTQNPKGLGSDYSCLVRATGLEPAHRRYKILNLTCLPISPRPPFGVVKFFHTRPPFGAVKFFHTRPPFGARGIHAQKGWTLLHVHALLYHVFRHLSSPFSLSVLTNRSARISPPCTLIFPPQAPLAKVLGVLRTFFQEGSKWVWAKPKVLGSQIPPGFPGGDLTLFLFLPMAGACHGAVRAVAAAGVLAFPFVTNQREDNQPDKHNQRRANQNRRQNLCRHQNS